MQAISTKYLLPTDANGPRVRAKCDAGSLTVAWDHALSLEQNHHRAAQELVRKLNWTVKAGYCGEWVGGALTNGDYAWVLKRGSAAFTA